MQLTTKTIQVIFPVACLLLVLLNAAQAQLAIGLKGGASFTGISNYRGDTRVTGHGGVFVQARLDKQLFIQPELLYTGMGKRSLVFPDGTVTLALDYVQLPVLVQYYVLPKCYIEMGPQLSILSGAKIKFAGGEKVGMTSNYNTTDFALNFGLGVHLVRRLRLYGRYGEGFTDISKNDSPIYRNKSVQLGLALKVN
jgi:hypothetical protein